MPRTRLAAVAVVAAVLTLGSFVVAPMANSASGSLVIQFGGNGSGVVTSPQFGDGTGVCPPGCTWDGGYYVLTARPSAGSAFAGWSTAFASSPVCEEGLDSATCIVNAILPTDLIANFTLIPEILTVAKKGDGTGAITSSPAGISCGATCSHPYDYGTSITLTAETGTVSSFAGWSGACTGTAVCTLSMKAAQSVEGTFLKDCLVPKLRDKSLRRARGALVANDCTVGRINRQPSRTVKRGHVIAQKPKAGNQLNHGARVSLVLSTGKP